jgi:hypothetical protein
MNKDFELYVLYQIYEFLIEREGFNKKSPHNQVLDFFKEAHLGAVSDFIISSPSSLRGKFGNVTQINLLNVPLFRDKDRFIKWAYKQLN